MCCSKEGGVGNIWCRSPDASDKEGFIDAYWKAGLFVQH